MVPIKQIQSAPGWSVVTGPSINGTPDGGIPTLTLTPKPILSIVIAGVPGKYADGVARSPDLPIPPNTGHALLTAVFAVDDASLQHAQGLELGAKFTLPNGLTLNGQIQFSYGQSPTEMVLCLTSITGSGWSRTKVVLPKFAPRLAHTVSIAYVMTETNIGVPTVAVDGKLYTMPIGIQGVPGKALGWKRNAFQTNFQANSKPGGNWGWDLLDVSADFS